LFKGNKNQTQKTLGRPRISALIKEGRMLPNKKIKALWIGGQNPISLF